MIFLGHEICSKVIATDPEKVATIKSLPMTRNPKERRSSWYKVEEVQFDSRF